MNRLLFSHVRAAPSGLGGRTTLIGLATVYTTPSFARFSTANGKLFDKILVANRGEIACRVFRTANRLGIKTVAVYSDADVNALHTRSADEAVCVGPAPTSQSYLNIDAILEACRKTGAQAVHPGYGFLSENSKFVAALEKAGITFIGPPSAAMQAMGDKIESKKIAKKAGVSVIPGYLGEVEDMTEVLKIANEIGYPVMVKASAGGGGKGMRIAWNDEDVKIGFRLSKQEAKSSFGDDRMLIEKYIDQGRHIEIQVMADNHGTALYYPERECSIQRRNQKVIEEAPSPFLDEATRKAMGEQAVSLVKAVGYRSAGTVEFLVDSKRNFYFLEMNTRLQVEHPITEYITGVDLVEQMIRVAANQALPLKQSEVKIKGWAFESRVYAEDPYRNFLPSIGKLTTYKPPEGEGVRVDEGVYEGGEISIYYDPLICKLCTHGATRAEAIDRMKGALDSYIIRGVNHNIPFLRAVTENERFIKGNISTKFIPEEFPDGFSGFQYTDQQKNTLVALASSMHLSTTQRNNSISDQLDQNAEINEVQVIVTLDGVDYPVTVAGEGNSYIVSYENSEKLTKVKFEGWLVDTPLVNAVVARQPVTMQVAKRLTFGYRLIYQGTEVEVLVRTPRQVAYAQYMPVKQNKTAGNALTSPMPGQIHSIAVKEGDKVVVGQELAIVEAMKMQNVLRATHDAVVKKVLAKPGTAVAVDEVLIEFTA